MYNCFAYTYICVPNAYPLPSKVRRDIRYLEIGVMGNFELPCGYWEHNLSLLQGCKWYEPRRHLSSPYICHSYCSSDECLLISSGVPLTLPMYSVFCQHSFYHIYPYPNIATYLFFDLSLGFFKSELAAVFFLPVFLAQTCIEHSVLKTVLNP